MRPRGCLCWCDRFFAPSRQPDLARHPARLSFPALLAELLVAGVFVGTRLNLWDPDTWWHIRVGQKILAEWKWPTTDPFSFTVSGNDWMAYEWLGEVLIGFSTRWGWLVAPFL